MFIQGRLYSRRDLHAQYGGQQQGGISTPKARPLIFLFSGDSGQQYGYKDGLTEAGIYQYTGEGQIGDMQFVRGNLAIRDHVADGKDLHWFEYAHKGSVRYVGQMVCIGYHLRHGPDMAGKDRQVIVFELVPVEAAGADVAPDNSMLHGVSLGELRHRALAESAVDVPIAERRQQVRLRSQAVRLYALGRANGICEACEEPAPFIGRDGKAFLEVHHLRRLSDGGPEHPDWVAAICPNCHRRAHYGLDSDDFNKRIIENVRRQG